MVIHNTYSADRTTAVCQDWGFSGISVFLLHLRSAENTRFQKSPTSASAKTLAVIQRKITEKQKYSTKKQNLKSEPKEKRIHN
jgi:hypothetical protein